MRAETHIDLLFWCTSRWFACTKLEVTSGTQILFIPVQNSLFSFKIHTWGLGPIETRNSDARHAVLHAENHRCSLGPIETCNFGPKAAVLKAQNHRWGLEPIETSDSGANHAFLYVQNDRWGLVPVETCMLAQKSLFCMQKPQMRAETSRDYTKFADLHAQNHTWGMEHL